MVSHKNTQKATNKYKTTDNTDLHGSCMSFFVGAVVRGIGPMLRTPNLPLPAGK